MKDSSIIEYAKTMLCYLMHSCIVFHSKIDRTSVIRRNCRIMNSTIGCYTYVTRDCLIQNTEIGNFCSISERCTIGMPSHPIDYVSTSPVFLSGDNYLKVHIASIPYADCDRTMIGNDVWIGTGAMIKSGIRIGNGAVVAAGAVVTHDVESYTVVAGVPARVLRYRMKSREMAKRIADTHWWNCDEETLQLLGNTFEHPDTFLEEFAKQKGIGKDTK